MVGTWCYYFLAIGKMSAKSIVIVGIIQIFNTLLQENETDGASPADNHMVFRAKKAFRILLNASVNLVSAFFVFLPFIIIL